MPRATVARQYDGAAPASANGHTTVQPAEGELHIDYTVKLEDGPDADQTEEAFTVSYGDGATERLRIHDYTRVYEIPGLYEEVVQHQLRCASPDKIAAVLLGVAEREGRDPHLLRVLDLGAGNGVVGEKLRERGVDVLVATDSSPAARKAAGRDRPGLYASYVVGDSSGVPELGTIVRELGINCIVCAGALGFDHIEAGSFAELWDLLPPGAMFALTVHEDLVTPGSSDIGDELELMRADENATEFVVWERFRHRQSVAGESIHYVAVGALKGE